MKRQKAAVPKPHPKGGVAHGVHNHIINTACCVGDYKDHKKIVALPQLGRL